MNVENQTRTLSAMNDNDLYHARRVGRAFFLITRPHAIQVGREKLPANTVRLVDGWGNLVDREVCPRIEFWDPDATNMLGGVGAFRFRLNQDAVSASIARMRERFPEFRDAPVRDNSGEFAKGVGARAEASND